MPGQNGLLSINYERGQIFVSGNITPTVTASYAVKDFSIVTPMPDIKLLIEEKQSLRPKVSQNMTGLQNDEINFPTIYISSENDRSKPFAFGGLKTTENTIGLYIFSDSKFKLDALNSICLDSLHDYVPLISNTGVFPYNNLGGFKNNVNFNYNQLTTGYIGSGQGAFINDVSITSFNRKGLYSEITTMSPDVFFGLAEFELIMPRLT